MSQLLRRGFIAALAPAGVPNCDIVVTDDLGDRLCAIQVKSRRELGSDGGWHMGRKHEALQSPSLFYCFVDFGASLETPAVCYLLPSQVVASALKEGHQAWLKQPGRGGKPHKDSDFRRFLPCYEHLGIEDRAAGWLTPYREGWDVLRPAAALEASSS